MNEFSGAVLVNKDDIQKALDEYDKMITPAKARCDKVVRELALKYDNLPWYKKALDVLDDYGVMRVSQQKVVHYLNKTYKLDYSFYLGVLHKTKYLTKSDYDLLCYNVGRDSLITDLKALLSAGDVIYLNPQQAHFVGFYSKLNKGDKE